MALVVGVVGNIALDYNTDEGKATCASLQQQAWEGEKNSSRDVIGHWQSASRKEREED
jgi:hypothetical protein